MTTVVDAPTATTVVDAPNRDRRGRCPHRDRRRAAGTSPVTFPHCLADVESTVVVLAEETATPGRRSVG